VKMTAAVLGGVRQKLQIDEVELAPPRDGEVLVKVAASGLCASDLNAIDGKRILAPFPLVPGHEAAGVVAQTGPGVTRLKAGDAVVMSIVPSCGGCPPCARGRRNYCQTAGRAMSRGSLLDCSLRLSRNGGPLYHFLTVSSFAQYAVVPESGAVAIDARMPLDRAALISCAVLTGVGAVRNTARVRPGSRRGLRVRRDRPQRRPGGTPGRGRPHRRDRPHRGKARPGAQVRRDRCRSRGPGGSGRGDWPADGRGRLRLRGRGPGADGPAGVAVPRRGRRGRRGRAHASSGHGDAQRRGVSSTSRSSGAAISGRPTCSATCPRWPPTTWRGTCCSTSSSPAASGCTS
jgi:Alcohol dehydrogenase GroES-like domain